VYTSYAPNHRPNCPNAPLAPRSSSAHAEQQQGARTRTHCWLALALYTWHGKRLLPLRSQGDTSARERSSGRSRSRAPRTRCAARPHRLVAQTLRKGGWRAAGVRRLILQVAYSARAARRARESSQAAEDAQPAARREAASRARVAARCSQAAGKPLQFETAHAGSDRRTGARVGRA